MKANGEQVDDRIVEVCWDPIGEHWRMMRYRDDKPQGNHRSVVENVIQSIADGVEKDTVGAAPVGYVGTVTWSMKILSAAHSIGHDKKRMENASWSAYATATTTAITSTTT
jgi:mRNA capping family enzyme